MRCQTLSAVYFRQELYVTDVDVLRSAMCHVCIMCRVRVLGRFLEATPCDACLFPRVSSQTSTTSCAWQQPCEIGESLLDDVRENQTAANSNSLRTFTCSSLHMHETAFLSVNAFVGSASVRPKREHPQRIIVSQLSSTRRSSYPFRGCGELVTIFVQMSCFRWAAASCNHANPHSQRPLAQGVGPLGSREPFGGGGRGGG